MRQIIFLALLSAFSLGYAAQPTVNDIEYYSKFSDYWKGAEFSDGKYLAVGARRDGQKDSSGTRNCDHAPEAYPYFSPMIERKSVISTGRLKERVVVGVARYNPSETTRSFLRRRAVCNQC